MNQHPEPYKSLNPFAAGDTDAIRILLMASIAETEPSRVWASRADALAVVMAPVLMWMHDAKGIELTPGHVNTLMQFDTLVTLSQRQLLSFRPMKWIDCADLPDDAAVSIQGYLAELPGFDPAKVSSPDSPARNMHFYALFALRRILG